MAILSVTDFGDGKLCVIVDHDPTVTVTNAPAGSFILYNNKFYQKITDTASPPADVAQLVDYLTTDPINAAAQNIRESGGQTLSVGAIANGQSLIRSGTSLVGSDAALFGDDYQSAVSEAESSVTGAWTSKVSLTTGTLTGSYILLWSSELRTGKAAKDAEARLYNTTDAAELGYEDQGLVLYQMFSGFALVTFAGAAKTFALQYQNVNGDIAYIRRARLALWRVS